jgi:hypothetical protein
MRKSDEDTSYYVPNFENSVEFSTRITLLKLYFLIASLYQFRNLKKVGGKKKDSAIAVTGCGGP